MADHKQSDVRYITRYCALLQREVEVVLIPRADGSWVLIRCHEKNKRCDGHECPLRPQSGPLHFEETWW